MNREKRYQITKERNESDMICEKIIDTKPTDKQIIEKIKKWLKSNIRDGDINNLDDLITDNKNLLRYICDLAKGEYDN